MSLKDGGEHRRVVLLMNIWMIIILMDIYT